MNEGIRDVEISKGESGNIEQIQLVFGDRYFVEITVKDDKEVQFILGATHHGFRVDASGSELEAIIYEIREKHADLVVD